MSDDSFDAKLKAQAKKPHGKLLAAMERKSLAAKIGKPAGPPEGEPNTQTPERMARDAEEVRAQLAREFGGDDPVGYAQLLERAGESIDPLLDTNHYALAAVKPSGNRRPLGESYAELRRRGAKPPDWLICELITSTGLVAISGEPKSAKSWTAIDLAVSIASGSPALGRFAVDRPAGAFYFFAEDHEGSIISRVGAVAAGKGLDPDGPWSRLLAVQAGRRLDLTIGGDLCVLIASVWRREQRTGRKVEFVVLDPLSDVHSGQEDKRDSMRPILNALRVIARDILKCTIAFVHHSGKVTAENKGRKRGGQKMRGSSAIHGAVDGGVYLDDLRGDRKTVFTSRVESEVRSGRSAGTFDLTLNIEDDDQGRAVKATHATSERIEPQEADHDLAEQRAEAVVHKLFAQEGPLTVDELQRKIPGKRTILCDAIEIAAADGFVAPHNHGKRAAGYAITEAGKDYVRGRSPAAEPEPRDVPDLTRLFGAQS